MAEPDIVSSLASDPSGLQFDEGVRVAGQTCRDALERVCAWHVALGLKLSAGDVCSLEPKRPPG